MDLVKVLTESMTSLDSLSALTGRSGGTPKQIKSALDAAIPGLLGTMTENASTEEGAQSLLGALSQHTNSGSMRSQLAGADLVDGDKIITKILGGTKTDFINEICKASGLDFNQTRTVLSNIAPAMMSSVAAANSNFVAAGAKSGVDSSYPGGTTRSEYSVPSAAIPSGNSVPNQVPAGQSNNQSSLKDIFGSLITDEEDKKILEGMQGKSFLQNLKDFIL